MTSVFRELTFHFAERDDDIALKCITETNKQTKKKMQRGGGALKEKEHRWVYRRGVDVGRGAREVFLV